MGCGASAKAPSPEEVERLRKEKEAADDAKRLGDALRREEAARQSTRVAAEQRLKREEEQQRSEAAWWKEQQAPLQDLKDALGAAVHAEEELRQVERPGWDEVASKLAAEELEEKRRLAAAGAPVDPIMGLFQWALFCDPYLSKPNVIMRQGSAIDARKMTLRLGKLLMAVGDLPPQDLNLSPSEAKAVKVAAENMIEAEQRSTVFFDQMSRSGRTGFEACTQLRGELEALASGKSLSMVGGLQRSGEHPKESDMSIFYTFERINATTFSVTVSNSNMFPGNASWHPKQYGDTPGDKERYLGSWRILDVPQHLVCEEVFLYCLLIMNTQRGCSNGNGEHTIYSWLLPYLLKDRDGHLHASTCPQSSMPDCFVTHQIAGLTCFKSPVLGLKHLLTRGGLNGAKRKSVMYALRHLALMVTLRHLQISETDLDKTRRYQRNGETVLSESARITIEIGCRQLAQKALREDRAGRFSTERLNHTKALILSLSHAAQQVISAHGPRLEPGPISWDAALDPEGAGAGDRRWLLFSGFSLALRPMETPADFGAVQPGEQVRHLDFLELQSLAPLRDDQGLVKSIEILHKLLKALEAADENEWRWAHMAGITEWAACHLFPVPGQHSGDGELWQKLNLEKAHHLRILQCLHDIVLIYAAAVSDFGLLQYSDAAYASQVITITALVAYFEQVNRYGCASTGSKMDRVFSYTAPPDTSPKFCPNLHFSKISADAAVTDPAMLELRDKLMCSSRVARPNQPALFRFPPMKDKWWKFTKAASTDDATLDAARQVLEALGYSEENIPPWLEQAIAAINKKWAQEAEAATQRQAADLPPVVPRVLRVDQIPVEVKLYSWANHPEGLAKLVKEWGLLYDIVFAAQWLSLPPRVRIDKCSSRAATTPSFGWQTSFTLEGGQTPCIQCRGILATRMLRAEINFIPPDASWPTLSWAKLERHEPAVAGTDPEAGIVGLRNMSLPPFGQKKSSKSEEGAVTEEEAESMLCALGAPYVRIPLLVGFFAADRCHLLRFERVRVLFEAALAEPGPWVSASSPLPVRTAPVDNPEALGRPLGLLAMEASQGTETLLTDLERLIKKASEIADAEGVDEDYDGASAEIFLCVLRVAVRCEAALRRHGPASVVALSAPVLEAFRVSTARRQLRAWFDTACRRMDEEAALRFQVHLAFTVGAGLVAISAEDVTVGVSAVAYMHAWGATAADKGEENVLPKQPLGLSCTEVMQMEQSLRPGVESVFPKLLASEGMGSMLSRVLMVVSHSTDPSLGEPWSDKDLHGNQLKRGHFQGGSEDSRVTVDLQSFRVCFHTRKLRPLPPEMSQAADYRELFGERFPSCQLGKYANCMVAQLHLDDEEFELRHWYERPTEFAPGSTGWTGMNFTFDGRSWQRVNGEDGARERFRQLGADEAALLTFNSMPMLGKDGGGGSLFGGGLERLWFMPADALEGHNEVPCLVRLREGAKTLWLEICLDCAQPHDAQNGIGSMEQPEVWRHQKNLMKHGVRVYRLVDHGRRCLKVLTWAADYNRAYRSDWLPNVAVRTTGRPPNLEHAVGWLFAGHQSGQHAPPEGCGVMPDETYKHSLDIVQLSSLDKNIPCPREWVPNRLLVGLLPGALLEDHCFLFWRRGTTISGIPRADCPGRGNGWFDYELIVALHEGHLCEIVRAPQAGSAGMVAWRQAHLCLINTAIVPGSSPWRPVADLFAGIEPLSHVLMWAYAEDARLAVVELPRLQLRFLPRGSPTRLYSVEFDGFYVLPLEELEKVDARASGLPDLLKGLPHWLLLRKDSGEVTVLVPNGMPLRPKAMLEPFTTSLVMDHRSLPDYDMRYFRWDLHIGGTLLLPSTLQGTLYLCLMKLLARDYVAASKLVESCTFDEDMTAGEARVFSRFFWGGTYELGTDGDDAKSAGGFLDDFHPDACAIRVRLALGAADFQNSSDHVASAHLQLLRTYLDPGNQSMSKNSDINVVKRTMVHRSRVNADPNKLPLFGQMVLPRAAHGRCVHSSCGNEVEGALKKNLKFCNDDKYFHQAVHANPATIMPPSGFIDIEPMSRLLLDFRDRGPACCRQGDCGFLRLYALARGDTAAKLPSGDNVAEKIVDILARHWVVQLRGGEGPEIRAAITLLHMLNAEQSNESNDPAEQDNTAKANPAFPDLDGIAIGNWVTLDKTNPTSRHKDMTDAQFEELEAKRMKIETWPGKVQQAVIKVAAKTPLVKSPGKPFGGEMRRQAASGAQVPLKPAAQLKTGIAVPFMSPLTHAEDEALMARPLSKFFDEFVDVLPCIGKVEPAASLEQDAAEAEDAAEAATEVEAAEAAPAEAAAEGEAAEAAPVEAAEAAPAEAAEATPAEAAAEGEAAEAAPVEAAEDAPAEAAEAAPAAKKKKKKIQLGKFSLRNLEGLAGSHTEVAKGMMADYACGVKARQEQLADHHTLLPKVLNINGDSKISLGEAAEQIRLLMEQALEQWRSDIMEVKQQHELLLALANDATGASSGEDNNAKPNNEKGAMSSNPAGLRFWLSRAGGREQTAWLEYCLGALAYSREDANPFKCRFDLLADLNGTITAAHGSAILDAAQRLMFHSSRASMLQLVVASASSLAGECEKAIGIAGSDSATLADLPELVRETVLRFGELLAGSLAAQRTSTYLAETGSDVKDKVFDYRLLLFEYVSGFMLRPKQYSAVQDMFSSLSIKNEPRVVQMIMGSGKTACVAPLLTLLLSSPNCLVVNVVPHPLVAQTRSIFRRLFGITLSRRIFTLVFARDDAKDQPGTALMPPRTGLETLKRLHAKLTTAKELSSIVITTPASMKSLILKYVEFELEGGGGVHEHIRTMAGTLTLLRNHAAALVDEVDWVLDPLKSELNFPLGPNVPYPQQAERVDVALVLLDAVMLDRGSDGNSVAAAVFPKFREIESSEAMVALKGKILDALGRGYAEFALQRWPHMIVHSIEFYKEQMRPLIAEWFVQWLTHEKAYAEDIKEVTLEQLVAFLVQPDAWMTDITAHIESTVGEKSRSLLNLARTWLHAFLPFLLTRADRVHFGLLDDAALIAAAAADAPTSRRLLGVPFVAKDVPAQAAEFAHPDILIGYTALAYCIEGLRLQDIRTMLVDLVRKATQEPGPVAMRPTARLFDDWVTLAQKRRRARLDGGDELAKMKVPDLPTIGHLGGPEVVEQLWQILRKEPEVNYWYMREKAFPQALRMQREKLSASGQELGSEMIFAKRAGFSGTPSALLPQELGTCHFDLENLGEILLTLTNPAVVCQAVRVLSPDWTPEGLLLDIAASKDPALHALIDTGAIITGLSNQQVAECLLKNLPSEEVDGVVFLDERDRQMVCLRGASSTMRLQESGVPKERRFCFYDQVHTTGIDVKHRMDAVALVTVNATMTYRDLAQGCWRMRGIGMGQTIHIILTPEIHRLIGRRLGLADEDPIGASEVVLFLMSNHFVSESKRHVVLQYQNLGTLWRKRAFKLLIDIAHQDMGNRNRRTPILNQFRDPVDYNLAKKIEAPTMLHEDLRKMFETRREWMRLSCIEALQKCESLIHFVEAAQLQADGSTGVEEEKEKEQEKEMEIEKDIVVDVSAETGSVTPWPIEAVVAGDIPMTLYEMKAFKMAGLSTSPLHFPTGTYLSHNHTFNHYAGKTGQRRMKSVRCLLLCWDFSGEGRTVGISLQEAEALRRYVHVMEGGGTGNDFTNAAGYFEVRLRNGAMLAALPGCPPTVDGVAGPELEIQSLALRFFNTDVDLKHGEATKLVKSMQEAGSTSPEREQLVHLLFGARRRDGTAWQRTILAKCVWDDADKLTGGERLLRELCSAAAGRKLGWSGLWEALDRRRAMCVGLEDISAFAELARLEWSPNEAAQLLAYVDVNGVGVFDLSEFQSALEKQDVLPRGKENFKVLTREKSMLDKDEARKQGYIEALDNRFSAARAAMDEARDQSKQVLGYEAGSADWPTQRAALEVLLNAKAQAPSEEDFQVLLVDPEVRFGALGGTNAADPSVYQPWQILLSKREEVWTDCEPELQAAFQKAIAAGEHKFQYEARGQQYEINVKKKKQKNLRTGASRKIRQKPVGCEEDGDPEASNDKAPGLRVPWLEEAAESSPSILELLESIEDEEVQLQASRLVHRILVTSTDELAGGRALRKAAKLRLSAAEDAVAKAQQIERASEELRMTWGRLVEGDVAAAAAALRWGTMRPGRILLGLRALCALHCNEALLAGEVDPGLEPADALAAVGHVLSRTSRCAVVNELALRVLIGFVAAWSSRPVSATLCQQVVSLAHRAREHFPADNAVCERADKLTARVQEWQEKAPSMKF